MEEKLPEGRRKKWVAICSMVLVLAIMGLMTWFVWRWLASFSNEGFRDYIHSYDPWGWLVLLGLQFLQVFVALIPGEVMESAAGFAFGPLKGTLICYGGMTAASVLIFYLTKRFGIKLVEIFTDPQKIRELRFLRTEKRRDLLIFLIYFIPGTPKDLLTYFVGLTDIGIGKFLWISLIARIPSVLTSTFGGHLLGQGSYWGAVIVYALTGALSLGGIAIYKQMINKRKVQ